MLNIKQISNGISNVALFQANTNLNNCLLYNSNSEPILDNNFNPVPVAQTIAFTLQTLNDMGNKETVYISIAKQIDNSPTQIFLEPASNYDNETELNPIHLLFLNNQELNFRVAIILI